MNIEFTPIKVSIAIVSVGILIILGPIIRWFGRDKYKTYYDIFGNEIIIKTQGYVRLNGQSEMRR